MEENKLKYEPPFTIKEQVEMESIVCAGSVAGTPVNENKNRHVNINEQTDGGSIGFIDPGSWD